jgi:lipopolysaccharide transport system ATP-binding protein
MEDYCISIRGVGKKFNLRENGAHDTLRDQISALGKRLLGKSVPQRESGEFWAVKDVSFDVKPGDVVGIVGHNGAGKSTLLKLLSQISEPSAGEIRVRGRIASLLEVGTGFHPELSGRENIFLNGAILGMTKAEIRSRFDEIVAFAEVEKFLDTPVKRYSSGMYVRLAFAVAANLEPEILVVDEVLAVGDIQFQKRCLGKMADVAKSGRTILFVSHNLAAVQKLCTRGVLLKSGSLVYDGGTEECITRYLTSVKETQGELTGYAVNQPLLDRQSPDAPIRVTRLEMFDLEEAPLHHMEVNDGFRIRIHYECTGNYAKGTVSVQLQIRTHLGQELVRLSTMPISGYEIDHLARDGYVDLTIDSLPLVGGRYLLGVYFFRPHVEAMLSLADVVTLEVSPTDVYGSGVGMDQNRGLVVTKHKWHHEVIVPKVGTPQSDS